MEEFLRSYAIWILLAGVFAAMHWFGVRGAGHHYGERPDEEARRSSGSAEGSTRSTHSGGRH